ncbi:MAG: hypothetical protein KGD58_05255 [Candidatus Lokiarchaeota archaeon]|nr:hypothetical protein [Candidatus Lokiarchaeota archaeon]
MVEVEREDILLSFRYLFGFDPIGSYFTNDMRETLEQVLKQINLNRLTLLAEQLSSLLITLTNDDYLLEYILSEEFIKVYLQMIFQKDFSQNPGYLINLIYSFFKDLEKLYYYIGELSSQIQDTPAGMRSEEECYSILIPTLRVTENGDLRIESDAEYNDWLFQELHELLKQQGTLKPIKTQTSSKYPYQRSHSLLYEKSVLRRDLKEKEKKPIIEKKPIGSLKQLSLFGDTLSNRELEKSQERIKNKLTGEIQEIHIEENALAENILSLFRKYNDFLEISNDEKFSIIKKKIQNSKSNSYPLIRKFLFKLNVAGGFVDTLYIFEMELFQRLQKRYSDLSNFVLNEYKTDIINSFKQLTSMLQIFIDLTKNYNQEFYDDYIRNYIANNTVNIKDNRIFVESSLFGKDYEFPINLKELANQVSEKKYNWFMFIYYRKN